MKGLTEEWLRANRRGISDEDLEKALDQGKAEYLSFSYLGRFFGFDVTFEPIIRRDVRIWIPILGWRPAAVNEFKSVKAKIHLKQRDRAIVCEAARLSGLPKATGKRQLSIFLRVPKGQRRWDEDAFWKSTQDACVHAGLLVNDSPVWMRLGTMKYDPERGPLRTTLILEDLPSGTP
jgi:hypothetical protein